jgi:pimeloyl-ACP methyl ester carboxylesterase
MMTPPLFKQLGIEQTDVFGYSVGGSVALQLALRHPALVHKLALASTIYHADGYYPEILEGLRHASPEGFPREMREAYERVAPNPEGWPALVAKAAQGAANPEDLRPEDVQSINVPALVMIAEGDIIRLSTWERPLSTELVVLPNSDMLRILLTLICFYRNSMHFSMRRFYFVDPQIDWVAPKLLCAFDFCSVRLRSGVG